MAASLNISGDNSSYTISLSGMATNIRYHVFVADLTSSGGISGYVCRRSSIGSSTTWSYSGTSSATYAQYSRAVIVRVSSAATSHVVGNTYSYSEVTSGTNAYDTQYIPAASSTTYVYYLKYDANGGSGAPSQQRYPNSGTTTSTGYTFTISSTTPTKSGCTFLGWALTSGAASASYQPGETIRVTKDHTNCTRTLYAVWSDETYTYYFRTLDGVAYTVYKNGTSVLTVSNSTSQHISVKSTDTITVCSPTVGGTISYTLHTGYTAPVYIYFDGSDGLYQNTNPTNITSDNKVSWKGRDRRIQLAATGVRLTYYFRCMTGVAAYIVYRNGTAALTVSGTQTSSELTLVTVNDTITVGASTTSGTPSVTHDSDYEAPDYIYFDNGTGWYQSTDPTDLQSDHTVSWQGYSRYIQIRATMKATKYRIHAFGNNGTISGASDVYRPTSSTWYNAQGVQATFDVSNLPTPVRSGYEFNGWAQSLSETSGVKTGTVTVNASVSGSVNNLYATWRKIPIGLFYWDGSTGTSDASLINSGQPFSNITGGQNGNWNRLKAKIAELRTAQGGSWSYSTVSTGDTFTAAEYNDVRSGIDACTSHGVLPSSASQNEIIYAHYFQSTNQNPNSLKSALNTAITTYNNS